MSLRRLTDILRALSLLAILCVSAGAGAQAPAPGPRSARADAPPARTPGPVVSGVELRYPEGFDATGLDLLVGVRAGQPLSKREVQRSIERLFATGRLADVVVQLVEAPRGVRVAFELTPIRRVGAVYVQGATIFTDEEVLAASGLEAENEFFPERVERAKESVQRLYERRGYRQVEVRSEVTEREGVLEILLSIDEGSPSRVLSVSFSGSPGLPLKRLLTALGLTAGDVLDTEVLEPGIERVRELYRANGHYRARLGEAEIVPEGMGARIIVPVDSGPRFTFQFRGNRSFPDTLLRSVLGYDGSESLDRSVSWRMARRLERYYRYRGFQDVSVRPREVPDRTGANALLVFDIEEGLPLFVRAVAFEGNESVGDERLREVLTQTVRELTPEAPDGNAQQDPLGAEGRTSSPKYINPMPEPETVFVAEAYREAATRMEGYYRARGYPRAKVTLASVDVDVEQRAATARFLVEEGPRPFVSRVTQKGAPPNFPLERAIGLLVGLPLTPERMETARGEIQAAFSQRGYLFSKLEVESALSEDGKKAVVHFAIEAGPQVRVGRVILQGLSRSRENVVRRNLALEEGDLLDPEILYASQRNLVALGIFRQVTVRLLQPDSLESTKDVVVEVRERPRLSGEFGGGYSLEDGPRIMMDAVYPNLTGRGINLSLRGKLNYVPASARALSGNINSQGLQGTQGLGGRGVVSFYQPRIYSLLPLQVGARIDFVAERVHRPFYRFSRYAAIAGLDWTAFDWLTVTLQYELENDRVFTQESVTQLLSTPRPVEEQRFLFEPGTFALQSLRPGITLDFRDDATHPRKGLLITGLSELTKDLGAQLSIPGRPMQTVDIFTLKASGSITGYVPLPASAVLALSVRGGKIFRLDPESRTVGPKRFFLGGATSMRGFAEDAVIPQDRRRALRQEVEDCRAIVGPGDCTSNAESLRRGDNIFSGGGEIFTLAKAELRLPLYRSLDLGLFVEAGNLWLDPSAFELWSLRSVSGVGIRYNTPIGPLAFDLGVNLDPDEEINESSYALHFSIGLF